MLICDIGINHNGSMSYVFDVIKNLAEINRNTETEVVLKFQKRTINHVFTKEHLDSPSCFKDETWRDTWNRWELSEVQYDLIEKECKRLGLKWSASVWDKAALDFIMNYNPPFIKIASASLADESLLAYVKYLTILMPTEVIMSLGMSIQEQIWDAINLVNPDVLMHCTSSYPTPYEEINLKHIEELFDYGKTVGFSSHSDIYPSILAIVKYNVKYLEHHITLDKDAGGPDDSASLELDEIDFLAQLMDKQKYNDIIDTRKTIYNYPSEQEKAKELRGYLQ